MASEWEVILSYPPSEARVAIADPYALFSAADISRQREERRSRGDRRRQQRDNSLPNLSPRALERAIGNSSFLSNLTEELSQSLAQRGGVRAPAEASAASANQLREEGSEADGSTLADFGTPLSGEGNLTVRRGSPERRVSFRSPVVKTMGEH